MKSSQNRNGRASRRDYRIEPSDWRRQPPPPPFCDKRTAAPEFDSACWIETAGRGAVEIHSMTRRLEDIDE